jgi:hypothetical protein
MSFAVSLAASRMADHWWQPLLSVSRIALITHFFLLLFDFVAAEQLDYSSFSTYRRIVPTVWVAFWALLLWAFLALLSIPSYSSSSRILYRCSSQLQAV